MKIVYTTQFKKDYKKVMKQNKEPGKLKIVVKKLVAGAKLEPKYKDHQLIGYFKGYRDCHIESDWLLIYKITDDRLILERTGSNSDLFNK